MIILEKYLFKRNIAATTASLIGAGISAAAAAGTAGMNAWASGKMNERAEKFNRDEAAAQREYSTKMWNETNAWNLEQWQREMEYNSPKAQVQRLIDAGLNPMYYGLDGNGTNAFADAAQPLGYQRANAPSYVNPVGAGIDALAQFAQVANIQAQTQKTKSETSAINAKLPFEVDSLKSQVRNSNLDADAKETVNKYLDQQQQAELRVKNATAAEADSMVQKAAAEIEKMDYEKTTMFIGWLETNEKILNLQKQRELTDKQMEELASLIAVNNATASKIGLDVSNYDDITVIGTASTTMKFGPVTVGQGEPITLGMKKAAEEHRNQLEQEAKDKAKKKDNNNQSYGSMTSGSSYSGPIYD